MIYRAGGTGQYLRDDEVDWTVVEIQGGGYLLFVRDIVIEVCYI